MSKSDSVGGSSSQSTAATNSEINKAIVSQSFSGLSGMLNDFRDIGDHLKGNQNKQLSDTELSLFRSPDYKSEYDFVDDVLNTTKKRLLLSSHYN